MTWWIGEADVDSTTNRRQLDDWMNERRRELRIRWTEVARRADMSVENLRRIRRGQTISDDAADGIEDALRWPRGSVKAAVTRGERPVGVPASESPEGAAEKSPRSARGAGNRDASGGGDTSGQPKVMTPAQMYAALEQLGWTLEQEEDFRLLKRRLADEGLALTPAIYLTMRRLYEDEQREPQTIPHDDGK